MVIGDNGTELISNAILKWQEDRFVEWHHIAPDKSMQNNFIESVTSRLRDECLNEHLFSSYIPMLSTSSKHGGMTTATTGSTPASKGSRQSNLQIGPKRTKT
jgi:putative transposase